LEGKIKKIIRERGFGFITTEDGKEVFFHRSALQGIRFDTLKEGDKVSVIYSGGEFLDLLPLKSSKAGAVKYIVDRFGVNKQDVVICGDSGNDLDIFNLGFKGIIVGNAHPELKKFNGKNAYHAGGEYSAGIIEGLRHFDFI